ncbi:MAG: helix-turn-helix domain-containing protein [Acidobacteriota bacterium]
MSPPSPKSRKPPTGAVLRQIREDLDLTQAGLAAILQVTTHTISDWEREDILSPTRLVRVAEQLGVPPQVVDAYLAAHQLHRHAQALDLPIPLAPNASTGLWATATSISGVAHGSLLDTHLSAQAQADRAAAAAHWAALSAAAEVDRGVLIEFAPDVATWALVERLAAESIEEAPDRPDTAMKLARLALRSAELAPVSEALRACLLGYAHGHIGNAYRVAAELRPAEAEFVIAREYWPEGMTAPAGLLSEARLFDLEASLRRDLRQFDKALELLDRALALTPNGPAAGQILLNRSAALRQMQDPEGSLEALRRAIPAFGEQLAGRPRFQALFNLSSTLLDVGRFSESLELLPEVRDLATQLRRQYDLIRLLWLEARALAGLGRLDAAIVGLDQVRRQFTALRNPYDAALAGLDLAALYLEAGKNSETRDLARQLAKVFDALRIKREQFAAVRLFLDAAEREAATAEMARRAAASLRAVRRTQETDDKCA